MGREFWSSLPICLQQLTDFPFPLSGFCTFSCSRQHRISGLWSCLHPGDTADSSFSQSALMPLCIPVLFFYLLHILLQ